MKPITRNALVKRINRTLAKTGDKLHSSPSYHAELGNYYVTDSSNNVTSKQVDLETWGREVGALKQHEQLAA